MQVQIKLDKRTIMKTNVDSTIFSSCGLDATVFRSLPYAQARTINTALTTTRFYLIFKRTAQSNSSQRQIAHTTNKMRVNVAH